MKGKRIAVRVTVTALAFITGVVMSGEKININKEKSNTFEFSKEEIVSMNSDEQLNNSFEEKYVFEYDMYDNHKSITLDEMNKNFEDNISKFDKNTQEYINTIYKNLVSNINCYSTYINFCGYPEATAFINEKFVEPIYNLNFIKIIPQDDPNYYELIKKHHSSCYSPEENGIYIFKDKYLDEEEMKLIIGEEIIHSGQKALDKFNDYAEYLILGEGEANIISSMQKNSINTENVYYFYGNDDINKICEIHGVSHIQNIIATRYYTYLSILAGYENINKWRETGDSKIIEQAITERFNVDGEKLYNNMLESIIDAVDSVYNKDDSKLFECENMFFECFSKIVDGINSKQEAVDILNLYRFLNIQYGLNYYDYSESNDGIDIINEFVSKKEVEEELYRKVSTFKALQVDGEDIDFDLFNSYINPHIEPSINAQPVSVNQEEIHYEDNNLILENGKYVIPIENKNDNIIKM